VLEKRRKAIETGELDRHKASLEKTQRKWKAIEIEDIEARVSELERAAGALDRR
jgi:hypothetical protein